MIEAQFWFDTIGFVFHDNNTVWLMQRDGEGMEVDTEEIEKLLQDYFKANF